MHKQNATSKGIQKITLNRESLRTLTSGDLTGAVGGIAPIPSWWCTKKVTC